MDIVALGDPSPYRGLGLTSLGLFVCSLLAGALKLGGRWSDSKGIPALRWWHVIVGAIVFGWGAAYFSSQVLAVGFTPDGIDLVFLSPRPSVRVGYGALRSLAVTRVESPSGASVWVLELSTDAGRSFQSMEGQRDAVLQVVDRLRSSAPLALEWRRRDASGRLELSTEPALRAP